MLRFHGDAEVAPGLVDLAVNVRQETPPSWLTGPIAASLAHLARYPDPVEATAAIAARHGRPADEVLLTAGAAQAFTLLAQALRPRHAVVVHPQFTEPESALLTAGHAVDRLLLDAGDGFMLKDPPGSADLVVIGNPTNPTSCLHKSVQIASWVRPGRTVVVDEAFADTVPGEPETLTGNRDVVVIRSLTKTWGLAGLRIGYVLGPRELIAELNRHAPLWSVSTPALAAAVACASPRAVRTEREIAERLTIDRDHLVAALRRVGVEVAGVPRSSFVLINVADGTRVREELRSHGFAVRRGETFPGLGQDWLRIAVRDTATSDAFVAVLSKVLGG
ncbi:Rv2231c family pyridoxal phosphate-dependent protein CobC [Dactylosporangium sp. NBC_01737]|uniref:Rv2231c family pyridoxal phosphate-dependent protein CobC n=1 Tax=Dactylosporangium sp. NBC_01737 TaxID=2975959 RepID=UPI002E14B8F0|nr:Rv2231c family pyridoxal phosphate-dependent protein CobC [Dactylosporangium sp. NBC_01737]